MKPPAMHSASEIMERCIHFFILHIHLLSPPFPPQPLSLSMLPFLPLTLILFIPPVIPFLLFTFPFPPFSTLLPSSLSLISLVLRSFSHSTSSLLLCFHSPTFSVPPYCSLLLLPPIPSFPLVLQSYPLTFPSEVVIITLLFHYFLFSSLITLSLLFILFPFSTLSSHPLFITSLPSSHPISFLHPRSLFLPIPFFPISHFFPLFTSFHYHSIYFLPFLPHPIPRHLYPFIPMQSSFPTKHVFIPPFFFSCWSFSSSSVPLRTVPQHAAVSKILR